MTDKTEAKKARVLRHVQFINDTWETDRTSARSILFILQDTLKATGGEQFIPLVGGLNVEALEILFDK